jgi:hypothetical protein
MQWKRMSIVDTFEKCRPAVKLSAFRRRLEVSAHGQNDEIDPEPAYPDR